jgi:polysaccharide pyruvyl transferase WcaK-like protein
MLRRVLCLGAYANGNVGDMFQAEALADAVRAARPDVEVTSVSPSARGTAYPSRNHVAGPADGAFDHDYINRFDMLLVGGGGLFSAPHRPLNDSEWVAGLRLPVVTVGVGAAGETPLASQPFLEKCKAVSVRDEYSLAAVTPIRPDATIVMDPILLYGPTREVTPSGQERRGILWLPGKLVGGTRPVYDDIMHRLYVPKTDMIASVNPVTDRQSGFDEVFGTDVVFFDSAEKFQEAAANYAFVVSERYHGCILGLTADTPCIGLSLRSSVVTSKIDELYRRIGYAECVVTPKVHMTRQFLRKLSAQLEFGKIRSYLNGEREVMKVFLQKVLHD